MRRVDYGDILNFLRCQLNISFMLHIDLILALCTVFRMLFENNGSIFTSPAALKFQLRSTEGQPRSS